MEGTQYQVSRRSILSIAILTVREVLIFAQCRCNNVQQHTWTLLSPLTPHCTIPIVFRSVAQGISCPTFMYVILSDMSATFTLFNFFARYSINFIASNYTFLLSLLDNHVTNRHWSSNFDPNYWHKVSSLVTNWCKIKDK